jgi:hypothetical protein
VRRATKDPANPSNWGSEEQISNPQSPGKIVALKAKRSGHEQQSNAFGAIQGGQERQSPSPATPQGKMNNEATIKGMGLDPSLWAICPRTVAEPLVNRRFDQQ